MVSEVKEVSCKVDLKLQKLLKQGRFRGDNLKQALQKQNISEKKTMVMTSDQTMMQAMAQQAVEAAKAAILVVAGSTEEHIKTMHPMPRMSVPTLKQPTFGWKTPDK